MMMFFSYVSGFNGGILKEVSSAIFTPMQSGLAVLGRTIHGLNVTGDTVDALKEENSLLKEELARVKYDLNAANVRLEELDRLTQLLALKNQYYQYETTGARIIASSDDTWFSNFTIDKGLDDGLDVGMNVIADEGLVGIISEVSANFAIVRTIIDDNSFISVTINPTADNCIVGGSMSEIAQKGTLPFTNLDKAATKVAIGNTVVTSQISDKYMPGLLVGYISSITDDDNELTMSGSIAPVVDFKHLSDVLIVKRVKMTSEIKSEVE